MENVCATKPTTLVKAIIAKPTEAPTISIDIALFVTAAGIALPTPTAKALKMSIEEYV